MEKQMRRILIVDGDSFNRQLMHDALSADGFEVQHAATGMAALGQMEQYKPELVLLDYAMPGLNGLEILKQLRSQENYVAVIFVSANTEPGLITECLGAGADDYIPKPFLPSELLSRVKVRLRLKDLADELRTANRKLEELSITDELTGLFNMRSMYERINAELRRARRFNRQIACLMADLDHFKEVNDTFDHLFGSFVLQSVGELIRKNVREVDFAARFGGDEFLIVLTESTETGAQTFAERLRATIEKNVFEDGKSKIQRTCSIGYALSDPKGPIDSRDLIRLADHALYEAKRGGRNQVRGAAQ